MTELTYQLILEADPAAGWHYRLAVRCTGGPDVDERERAQRFVRLHLDDFAAPGFLFKLETDGFVGTLVNMRWSAKALQSTEGVALHRNTRQRMIERLAELKSLLAFLKLGEADPRQR